MGTSAATAETSMTGPRAGKSQAAFRTISEVAEELDVAQHVLRFWESKFPQVRPLKRGGGRRYYRPEDIELLREIRTLLYDEGYTIKGAQKLLRQRRAKPAPAAKSAEKPVQQSLGDTAVRAEAVRAEAETTTPSSVTPSSGTPPAEMEAPEMAPSSGPSGETAEAEPEPGETPEPPAAMPQARSAPAEHDLERLQAIRRLMVEIRHELDAAVGEED